MRLEFGDYMLPDLPKLKAHAAEVRSLSVRRERWFQAPEVRALDLSRLTSFCCLDSEDVQDYSWWNGFDSLRSLRLEPLNDKALSALAAAPWINQLEEVILGTLRNDKDGTHWREFWHGRSVPWRSLWLGGFGWSLKTLLAEGTFPRLQELRIDLVTPTKLELYQALASANLPMLTDLELQGEQLSEDEFVGFLNSPRTGMPSLKRLDVNLSTGEVDGYIDGWFDKGPINYISYTTDELEERFLKRHGLTARPGK